RRRARHLARVPAGGDLADEPVAVAVDRPDEALAVAVVADGTARRLDARGERRCADEAIAPDLVEQLLLAHRPVAVGDQVREDPEDLRLDRNPLAAATELPAVGVELVAREREDHLDGLSHGRWQMAGWAVVRPDIRRPSSRAPDHRARPATST